LLILAAVVALGMGGVGYFSGIKSQKANSESSVVMAKTGPSTPWSEDSGTKVNPENLSDTEVYSYRYHPGGDPRNPPRDAPSAIHKTVVNVKIPDRIREKFDKTDKV